MTALFPRFGYNAWQVLQHFGIAEMDYDTYRAEVDEVLADPFFVPLDLDGHSFWAMLHWMHETETILNDTGIKLYCLHLADELAAPIGNA